MNDIATSYFKVTHGLAFEIVSQFVQERKTALATIDALCEKYGARKGRYASFGWTVEGLWFGTSPGQAWRPMKSKGMHGYYRPAKTNKAGRAILEELKPIRLPQDEELANKLGCPAFFTDFDTGGQFCGSAGVNEVGGVFYLETAKYAPPAVAKFGDGIVKIERGEYFTALDAKSKTISTTNKEMP